MQPAAKQVEMRLKYVSCEDQKNWKELFRWKKVKQQEKS